MEIRVTSVFARVGESPLFTATGVAVRRAGARRSQVRRYRARRYRARRYRARRYRARRRCGRDSFTALGCTRRRASNWGQRVPRGDPSAQATHLLSPLLASVGRLCSVRSSRSHIPLCQLPHCPSYWLPLLLPRSRRWLRDRLHRRRRRLRGTQREGHRPTQTTRRRELRFSDQRLPTMGEVCSVSMMRGERPSRCGPSESRSRACRCGVISSSSANSPASR